MAKRNNKFIWIGSIAGLFLMVISFAISKLSTNDFLLNVYSEIFGAGVAILVIAIILKLFKVKLT